MSIWRLWFVFTSICIALGGCCATGIPLGSYEAPSPEAFKESDLIGTWQAKYGTSRTDTIIIKGDGTYQQVFQSPLENYYYKSDWNKWYITYPSTEKPVLHLKKMRYCVYFVDECESTGRGEPKLYYDFSEDKLIELSNEVILRITIDDSTSRGIRLWHLQTDPDVGPEFFIYVDK